MIPQTFILVDYIVREMRRVLAGLHINAEAVERNLTQSSEFILSEYVVTILTQAGLERPKAHEKLRELSKKARDEGKGLLEVVSGDASLSEVLKDTKVDIDEYFCSVREVSKVLVKRAVQSFRGE